MKSVAPQAKSGKLLKRPAGTDAQNDSLWETDPSLAASLALVPAGDRPKPGAQSGSKAKDEKSLVPIPRQLPPSLVSLKVTGEWGKDQMMGVTQYLTSLQDTFGWDVSKLKEEYGALKKERKK